MGTQSQPTDNACYSHNELTALLTKAAVAAGCPIGVAEEVARAGCLMHAHSGDGVVATLSALDVVARERSAPQNDDLLSQSPAGWNFARVAVAISGPTVLDITIAAGLENHAATVTIEDLDSLQLLVAMAIVRHQDTGFGFKLILSDDSPVTIASGQTCSIGELPELHKTLDDVGQDAGPNSKGFRGYGPLVVTLIPQSANADEQAVSPLEPPQELRIKHAEWAAATRLAEQTYVPASESSRLGGAGAGLTDND